MVVNCSPWDDALYKDAAERTDMGYISLNGFLAQVGLTYAVFFLQNELLMYLLNCMMQWALMTLLDPPLCNF